MYRVADSNTCSFKWLLSFLFILDSCRQKHALHLMGFLIQRDYFFIDRRNSILLEWYIFIEFAVHIRSTAVWNSSSKNYNYFLSLKLLASWTRAVLQRAKIVSSKRSQSSLQKQCFSFRPPWERCSTDKIFRLKPLRSYLTLFSRRFFAWTKTNVSICSNLRYLYTQAKVKEALVPNILTFLCSKVERYQPRISYQNWIGWK